MLARSLLVVLLLAGTAHAAGKPPGYAVASAHPVATQAGMDVLAQGGNAFDAAVAISATLAVVEPYSSGIGGGGFWLLHRGSDGFQVMVDGRETAPLAATPGMYVDARGVADPKLSRRGALAAGIPGAPAAWVHIAKKYGSKPLDQLLAPAIRAARDGFPVSDKLARTIADTSSGFSGATAAILMPGGKVPAQGTLLRQPDLAATLEALAARGRDGFYDGDVAAKLVKGVRDAKGIWTLEDLRRYKVVERAPQVSYFRDYRIVSAPPPSAGGIALAQVAQMLEVLAWPPADPVVAKHLVVEALRRAYRDRTAHLGDPDFVAIPQRNLTSREYALAQVRDMKPDRATPSVPATPPAEGDNTSHFSVLDMHGNRVGGTLSINLRFGSGFTPAGTGVILNNEMDDFSAAITASNAYGLAGSTANAIAPGKRPVSSMSPTFVEGPRGLLIVGTPGGSRIVSMVLLGVLGFIQGLDADQIVALPRFHHQHLPDVIEFEPNALGGNEQEALRAMGHSLKPLQSPYGDMHVVWWDVAGNAIEAASDPRGIGAAQVHEIKPLPKPEARPVEKAAARS